MRQRNENLPVNTRPYLSVRDKFCILQKKAHNMRETVRESATQSTAMAQGVAELVDIIDSTPSIFYHNSLEQIKNKEDQINTNTLHQNNENNR